MEIVFIYDRMNPVVGVTLSRSFVHMYNLVIVQQGNTLPCILSCIEMLSLVYYLVDYDREQLPVFYVNIIHRTSSTFP